MIPDLLAQSLMALALVWIALNPRKVGRFIEECSHCEGWIRRDEMATEAQAILPLMQPHRVG